MSETEYLPFKAINVFIDSEHLYNTLEFVLTNIKTLPKKDQISFANAFKEYVIVHGFRNPTRAPLPFQVKTYVTAFEEKDEVVPFTLSKWVLLREDFAKKVKSWLESKGWKTLSLERNFDESEGFIRDRTEPLVINKLVNDFKKSNPDLEFNEKDLIMMIIWISGHLPVEESGL